MTTLSDSRPIKLADLMKMELPAPVVRLKRRNRVAELIDERGMVYEVDLDRVPDALALLGWIEHLAGKAWVTGQHIRELIRMVENQNGVKIDRSA